MKTLDMIKKIFYEAIEKQTQKERETYLNEVCRDNPSLRAEIDALLEAHFGKDDLLNGPILGLWNILMKKASKAQHRCNRSGVVILLPALSSRGYLEVPKGTSVSVCGRWFARRVPCCQWGDVPWLMVVSFEPKRGLAYAMVAHT